MAEHRIEQHWVSRVRAHRRWRLARLQLLDAGPWILTGAALSAWAVGLPLIDLRQMDHTGLVSQLPVSFYAALLLINAAFAAALIRREQSRLTLAVLVTGLVVMLYGITSVVEELPRGSVTWLHAGLADVIERTGTLPNTDARFEWPGFFVLVAFMTSAGGLEHPIELATWVPAVLNLLYVPALLVIYRAGTADWRLQWLGVWVFLLANWVGQDYFSPQGFNFLLYLTAIAIIITSFRPGAGSSWPPATIRSAIRIGFGDRTIPDATALAARHGGELVLVVIVLTIAVASSHQLTPFVLVASVGTLVLVGVCRLTWLPMLAALIVAAWLSYMTVDFLSGHLGKLLSDVGQADAIATASVTRRVDGSPGHIAVVQFRLVFTAALWSFAFAGMVVRRRAGVADVALVVLGAVPFGLVLLQSYGGEILLRVYLFSLPAVAFFVAALIFAGIAATSAWRAFAIVVVVCSLLGSGLMIARYGNERADYVSREELEGVNKAYDLLEPGGLIVRANFNDPAGYRSYESYKLFQAQNAILDGDTVQLYRYLQTRPQGDSILLLTRSQLARLELFANMKEDEWQKLIDRLRRSRLFIELYANRDAVIFAAAPWVEETDS